MAPGCFSHSSKEASSVNTRESSVAMDTKSDYIEISTLSLTIEHSDIESDSSMNQIPLPLTPFPGQEEDDADDAVEEDEDEDEKHSNEGKTDLLLIKKMPRLISSVRSPNFSSIDTADTFEILEQTIMKQKRLAKLKNTDLRRKVLLKRTFDLVLEIMDAENGFNDDEADSTSAPSAEPEQQPRIVDNETLELELHPSTCMEDDENEIEKKEAEKTTLIKLVESVESSARVPRQVKRRSSGSDEDDEEDDDESDDEDEQMYSLLNDQQLNYRDAKTTRNDELNIYIDSVEIGRVEKTARRSNHQRKRVKLTI